jgi:hypothetical protein
MFLTLFLNAFGSLTRAKSGTSRKYNDTALQRRPYSLCGKAIMPLASQNTLTKTPVRHFFITYEAVNDTFMLHIIHRTTSTPLSGPHTSINSRYTIICKSKMVLQLGLPYTYTSPRFLFHIIFLKNKEVIAVDSTRLFQKSMHDDEAIEQISSSARPCIGLLIVGYDVNNVMMNSL